MQRKICDAGLASRARLNSKVMSGRVNRSGPAKKNLVDKNGFHKTISKEVDYGRYNCNFTTQHPLTEEWRLRRFTESHWHHEREEKL
jgi:hypothetical protein